MYEQSCYQQQQDQNLRLVDAPPSRGIEGLRSIIRSTIFADEPKAGPLRTRRDASLPHSAQRLVAGSATGME